MIYYIKPNWEIPQKVETIAELIHTKKLVVIYDMIIFINAIHPNESCGVYVENGNRVPHDKIVNNI